jgi:hypothetical protein
MTKLGEVPPLISYGYVQVALGQGSGSLPISRVERVVRRDGAERSIDPDGRTGIRDGGVDDAEGSLPGALTEPEPQLGK